MLNETYKESRMPIEAFPGSQLSQASAKRTFGRGLNIWLQNFAILGAGLWAITVFVHKEFLVPRRIPAHLNASIDLEKAGTMNGHVAIQIRITAENASARTIHLLPAIYRVWGASNDGKALDEDMFVKVAQENVRLNKDEMVGRFGPETKRTLIAVGRVFTNWCLYPGERAVRTAVIQVPHHGYEGSDSYDSVIATLSLPVSHRETGLRMEWNVLDVAKSKLYFQPDEGRGDPGTPVDWHNPGFKRETGFAFSTARAMLSLWEDEPGLPAFGEPGIEPGI